MGINNLESTARLLNRDYVNRRGLDLSKEVLWVSIGHWEKHGSANSSGTS